VCGITSGGSTNWGNTGGSQGKLELSATSLQSVLSRGQTWLQLGGGDGRWYLVTVERLETNPRLGWLVSLHAPIVVHNSLLCNLEFELSEVIVVLQG